MMWKTRLTQSLRGVRGAPAGELSRAERWARDMVDLARHCAAQLQRDRAPQMAAALTYHTLFSLLPTLVVVLVVLQSFVSSADRQQFKQVVVNVVVRWLQESGPAPEPESDPAAAPGDEADAAAAAAKHREFREMRRAITRRFEEGLDKLETVNFGSIGVIGVLVLLYGATTLLASIEKSFNTIFGISRARPAYTRLPLYYTIITISPLVLLAGRWLQGRFGQILEAGIWTHWLVGPMVLLAPLLTTWLVLALMYTLIPNTSVSVRASAVGSLVAAVLWAIAIELLRGYVARATTGTFYGALYGALGLLPLFLLWLWLSWLIILFGLELAYTLQTLRGRQWREEQARRESELAGDPLWVLSMMAHIGSRFQRGGTMTDADLAAAMELPIRWVQQLGERLERQGLVHQVRDSNRTSAGYTLALPPERIRVVELLALARSILGGPGREPGAPAGPLLRRLGEVQDEALGDQSLASILAAAGQAPPSSEGATISGPAGPPVRSMP